MSVSIRPLQQSDIPLLADYWASSTEAHLIGMGADPAKLPARDQLAENFRKTLELPVKERPSYAVIWLIDGLPSGHSNVNKLTFGDHGSMHLHLWNNPNRRRGMGTDLVKLSIRHFFEVLQLKTLYCEPYALNPAPNNTLPKAGFKFIKTYRCTPGSINFEQEVNRYRITREMLEEKD